MYITKTKGILLLSFLCLIAFLLIFSSSAYCQTKGEGKIIKIAIQHVNPEGHPISAFCEYFAKHVEEETQGRVKVKVYPRAILAGGDWRVMLDQLCSNITQMEVDTSVTLALNFDPRFYILSYPFLFDTIEHQKRFFSNPIPAELSEIYKAVENKGIKVLDIYTGDFREFYTNKRIIKSPEDFKNLKIRIPPLPLWAKIAEALGFKGVTLPTGEVFTALQLGTIDGQENIFNYSCESRIYEVAKYITVCDYMGLPTVVNVNKKFWDSLPIDIQEVITRCVKEAAEVSTEKFIENRNKWLKKLEEDENVELYILSQKEKDLFRDKLEPVSIYMRQLIGEDKFEKILHAVEIAR